MHELSLCEGIIQVIESEAEKQNFEKVKTVWLEIGELSCVEPQAMAFMFDTVKKNTLAQNASLEIIKIKARALCLGCNKSVKIQTRYDRCSLCDFQQLKVTAGEEMRIKELEVD